MHSNLYAVKPADYECRYGVGKYDGPWAIPSPRPSKSQERELGVVGDNDRVEQQCCLSKDKVGAL